VLFERESQMRDFVKGKRDPLLIILYILRLLSSGPASITHVAYKTNLNHMSAQRYLSLMEGRGFLHRVLSTEGRTFWITQRGLVAMKNLMRAVEDVWSALGVTTRQETQA